MPRHPAKRCQHLFACVVCGDCPAVIDTGGGSIATLCGEHAVLLAQLRERGIDRKKAEASR
jgi:hypothetical protein